MAIMMLMTVITPMMTVTAEPGSGGLQPGLVGLTRKAAAEGIVMLKNANNALPLKNTEVVSLFGRHQINYFFVGYGSGGDVRYPYSTNLLAGMRRNPGININESLAEIYERWCAQNVPSNGSWGNWPLNHPEMPLTTGQVASARAASDTAVVVIGRSAGEDRESTVSKGSFLLTDLETDMLDKVTAAFDKVVVLLNVGNIIDMSWVNNYGDKIDAILYVWQGGMEAGPAVADVLSGDETPSGKMAATIAKTRADYPSAANFGNSSFINYAEDIFVGYRYFETFAQDKVMYPFGFGLSYTDFNIKTNEAKVVDGEIVLDITVTNTGAVKGKEVVQVYYGAPQGLMGKAAKSLVAYAKTNLLQPGASEDILISFSADSMASYDDAGYTGKKSAWVLEAGAYPIHVGNSVRSTSVAFTYNEPALRVVEQLTEAAAVWTGNAFARYKAYEDNGEIKLTTDMTPVRTIDLGTRMQDNLPAAYPRSGTARGIRLVDVYRGTNTMAEFIDQMSVQNLVDLTRGVGPMGHSSGIPGNASVYGGVTTALRNTYGIPAVSTTDGPSGIRMSAPATLIPIGTLLACTWNDRLVEELYAGVGQEMVLNGSDALLAPGMNLQRDPLCGRNFEYFSEDPLLTGQMGSNVVRGVQSAGVSATPKHFAANNQETARTSSDSRVSERALREIYLKGFEICVKTAKPQNLMMSYNIVNGVYAHYQYELATTILRDQWGFEGVTMTDWWMNNNTANQKTYPSIPGNLSGTATGTSGTGNARRIRGQIDVLMPGDQQTTADSAQSGNSLYGNPVTNVTNGNLTLAEVQRSAINVLNFVLKSARFRVDNNLPLYDYVPNDPIFNVDQVHATDPLLDGIMVDGAPLAGFSPLTKEYVFYARDMSVPHVVAATAPAGVTVEIIQPTATASYATIYARTAAGGESIYRVFWTNEAGLTPTVPDPIYAYLKGIQINGEERLDFFRLTYRYVHWCWEGEEGDVIVTATTPAGVTATITKVDNTYVIRAESDHQALLYYVEVRTMSQSAPRIPQSDDFAGTQLKSFWDVNRPSNYLSKPDGSVQIVTQGGDWYSAGTDMNNVVWQYAEGNWTCVTEVTYDRKPYQNYHQIGIIMFDNTSNWIAWRMECNSGGSPNPRFTVQRHVNNANTDVGSVTNTTLLNALPTNNGRFFLRIQKTGNVYTFSVSADGVTNWQTASGSEANRTIALQDPKFGLYAISGNTGNDGNTRLQVNFQDVTFSNISYATPVLPAVNAPVVNITPTGTTRLVWARDNFYRTSGWEYENNSGAAENWTVGYIGVGGMMLANINVQEAGYYSVPSRYAANAAATSSDQIRYSLHVDDRRIATYDVRGTGGWQNWANTGPQIVWLDAGLQKLMFYADTEGYNMHWHEFTKLPSAIVTFDSDGGSAVSSANILLGESVAKPADPEKYGYIFAGWYLDDEPYDFSSPLAGDITLVAQWQRKLTTMVRIDANPTMSVRRGEVINFSAILDEGVLTDGVQWSVSNPIYATVTADGTVTILNKTGTVTLTATDSFSKKSVSIILRIV